MSILFWFLYCAFFTKNKNVINIIIFISVIIIISYISIFNLYFLYLKYIVQQRFPVYEK